MISFFLRLGLLCLFPPFCVGCQRLGTYLCHNCFELCVFRPFAIELELDPCYLDSLTAPLELTGPVPTLIHTFKYQSVKPIGKLLAQLLFYTASFPPTEVISCVPLYRQRLLDRGFNQAEEIALHFAQLCHLPFRGLLVRTLPTSAQAKLKTRAERLNHLANCFKPAVTIGKPPTSVLLIDDVTTTGTTLNECAKVLKQMGVLEVHGLVVAHGN